MASEPAAWHRLFPSLPHGAYCTQTRRLARRPRILSVLSGPLSDHHHKSQNPQHADGQQQLSMWAESLPTLLMVHHYGRPTHALTELRRRLRRLRIHPNMYTFTHFSQPNAVYWKQRVALRPDLPHPQSDVYIGSISITYPSREHNRRAKLLGIQHGQFINAEPALR